MICWWSAITIGQTVYSTAWFKVTKRISEIGKVVRGATDLRYSVCPGAQILNCRKLNFWFRYTNFAGTFRFRRVFDHTSHSYRDLEAVRFWTISPSYVRVRKFLNFLAYLTIFVYFPNKKWHVKGCDRINNQISGGQLHLSTFVDEFWIG